jgi:hypothetical protein
MHIINVVKEGDIYEDWMAPYVSGSETDVICRDLTNCDLFYHPKSELDFFFLCL